MSEPRLVLGFQLVDVTADEAIDTGFHRFSFGCGHRGDVEAIRKPGHESTGWEPFHAPAEAKRPAAVVKLGFVLNVSDPTTGPDYQLLILIAPSTGRVWRTRRFPCHRP